MFACLVERVGVREGCFFGIDCFCIEQKTYKIIVCLSLPGTDSAANASANAYAVASADPGTFTSPYSVTIPSTNARADVNAHAGPYPRAITPPEACSDLHPISCSFAPPNSKSVATTFARTVIGAHSVAYSRANTSTY